MQFKSLLQNRVYRLLIGLTAGILFKFPVDVVLAILYKQHTLLENYTDYIVLVPASIGLFQVLFLINQKLDLILNREYSLLKRFILQYIIHFSITVLIVFPLKYLFNYFLFPVNFYVLSFELLQLFTIISIILIYNFVELGYFLIHKWRFSLAELERFKKENAEFKFETLVNQVNPHFLFNSLNTLSSLIYENQDIAANYIRELSKVYRYVLEHKENDLVSLGNDLDFLKSYVYLFELRFDKMLTFDFNIATEKLDDRIAPMTLQMLVENAVKHNIISKKKHLTIKIYSQNDYIIVENNLQKKAEREYSSGMGLKNIISRYAYLSKNPVIINENNDQFMVGIPLITAHETI